jgi:NAD(P)-dependent dehydrogenase (short-subunit alcohol dehydrogenase family)
MTEKNMTKALTLVAGIAGLTLAGTLLRRRRSRFDLDGKVVLITGGSRGLGLILARQFAAEKARVVICARDHIELDRARVDLQQQGAEVRSFPCDVTDPEAVQKMVDEIGQIDVLVNNAGIIQVGPIDTMTAEDFRRSLKTHFWGPLNTILAVLPQMRMRKAGRIVNISSVGGRVSVPHLLPYSASKFALVGLSRGLRSELRKDGILVTTVCPGLMRTGSPRNAEFKGKHREEYAWFSISDSLPFISINAERAASQILEATKEGRAALTISLPAKIAVLSDALFPEFTAGLLSLVNDFVLPESSATTSSAKGKDSTSFWSPSLLTTLTDKAALKNNEV